MLEAGAIAVKSLADHVFERLLDAIVKGEHQAGRPALRNLDREATRRLARSAARGDPASRRTQARRAHAECRPAHRLADAGRSDRDFLHPRAARRVGGALATERMSEKATRPAGAAAETHARDQEPRFSAATAIFRTPATTTSTISSCRVAAASGCSELLCNDLYHLLRIYRFQVERDGRARQDRAREHKAILAAMRKRDAGRGRDADDADTSRPRARISRNAVMRRSRTKRPDGLSTSRHQACAASPWWPRTAIANA